MRLCMVTAGDPDRTSGGYRYHRLMAAAAARRGWQWRFYALPAWRFPASLAAGPSVSKAVRSSGADLVLLDSIAAPAWASAPGMEAAVAVVHQPPGGMDQPWLLRRAQEPFDRAAYRRCKGIIAASEALACSLEGLGPPVIVVPPGKDLPPPDEPAGDLRMGRKAAIVCVGNWVPRKGIAELLDAFSRLEEPLATLHLVGDPMLHSRYGRRVAAAASRRDLRHRVVCHGAVTPKRVSSILAAADIFVLASSMEPYGTAYGEAMAAGLAVAGWDAGNLASLARNGKEAVMVPPGDVAALSSALSELACDSQLRRRLGEAARARATRLPRWEESSAAFLDVCARLAGLGS